MKFIHLSDLHLGKRLNEFSLIEDQKYILEQIIKIIDKTSPNGIIIAGDVYDKSVPSTEAVALFDNFLFDIAQKNIPLYIIGGNHDSQERLSFGGRLLKNNNIFISPLYNGKVEKKVLTDEFGTLNIYLLPFVKPSLVKKYFPDKNIVSYTDALNTIIENINLDTTERNILVTHQFVTGATTCESEELSVGGSDNVDASIFSNFDYVALGHIHSPQNIKENIRYCGTPLKYSFSEAKHVKSVTLIEIKEKNNIILSTHQLQPLHDLREIKGSYEQITLKSNYQNTNLLDYVAITLTNEDPIPDAVSKLRIIYPNLMKLTYDNSKTKLNQNFSGEIEVENKSPIQLFGDFFKIQNNSEMTKEQKDFITKIIQEIWEENI